MTFAKGQANKAMSERPEGTPLNIPNALDTFRSIAKVPQVAAQPQDSLNDDQLLIAHMMSCRKAGCLTCA